MVIRELAEWFIAISLKLILVKYTNIRSNRIFSDEKRKKELFFLVIYKDSVLLC
jgi:hypothetical protein